jgi:ribosomal protein S8E
MTKNQKIFKLMLNQNLIILKMKEKRTGGNFTQKVIFCFAMLVFLGSTALAQTKSISGVVKDASGETIIAASVIVKGTNIGTVTNIDGEFKLNVPANAQTLVVSYVGMKTEEIKISGNVINVTLTDNARMLDEVVAIGYGTTRRKDITGSVASVKADALAAIPVTSAIEAISGKLAGVQVTTTEGSPDAPHHQSMDYNVAGKHRSPHLQASPKQPADASPRFVMTIRGNSPDKTGKLPEAPSPPSDLQRTAPYHIHRQRNCECFKTTRF